MDRSTTLLVTQETGGGRTENSIPPPSATLDSNKICPICLSPFGQQLGTLDTCQHVFCLQCILQWSQTTNSCPVDRISFTVIQQRSQPGGDILKKFGVKNRSEVVTQDEEVDGGICEECGRSDRRNQLLLCTCCDSWYHMDCLASLLDTGPETDWICPECAVSPSHSEEEEVSDTELTDLLAEIDDGASTSTGRLRSSTRSQAITSTATRHSQRIQHRAARNLSLPAHCSLHVPKYLLRTSSSETLELDASNRGDVSD